MFFWSQDFIEGTEVSEDYDIVAFRPFNEWKQYHSAAFSDNKKPPTRLSAKQNTADCITSRIFI
jgi:hypothetical protein